MEQLNHQKTLRIAVGTMNPCKLKAVELAIRRILDHNPVPVDVDLDIRGYPVESNVSDQPYNDIETKRGAMYRAQNAYYYLCHQNSFNDTIGDATKTTSVDVEQQKHQPFLPHLAIGIEGGLELDNESNDDTVATNHQPVAENATKWTKQLYCMAWIAIYGRRTEWTNTLFATDCIVLPSNDGNDICQHITDKEEIFGLSKTGMFILPPSLSTLVQGGMELGKADDVLFRRTNSKEASGTVGLLTNSMIDRTLYYEHAIQLALIPWMNPNLYPCGHTP